MKPHTFLKLYRIVTAKGSKPFWLVICMSSLTSVFEAVGVFSVMPFMAAMSNPEFLDRLRKTPFLATALVELKDSEVIFGLGVGLVIVTWCVSVVSALTGVNLLKFAYKHEKILAELLLSKYLTLPYQMYSLRDTSELEKNVLHETHRLVHGVIVPWVNLITRSFSGVALITLLLMVSWEATALCGLTIGVAYWATFRAVKGPLKKYGEASTHANTNRYQVVSEALSGLKEVQHYALEARFLSLFSRHATDYVSALTRCDTTSLIPKYIFDAVIVTVAVGAVLVVGGRGEIALQLPVISVFALAAYRLMPVFHQIFNSFAVIRFNELSLAIVIDEMIISSTHVKAESSDRPSGASLASPLLGIQVKNVTYRYPSSRLPALNDVSFALPQKGLICIAGKSGSGKSTLLDLIAGTIIPQEGGVYVNGERLQLQDLQSWRAVVGLASQHAPLFLGTLQENVALWGRSEGQEDDRFKECLRFAALDQMFLQEEEPLVIGAGGRSVSGGQRQRISIARALYCNPKLLLLDEPTSALDRRAAAHIIGGLIEMSKSILVVAVSHDASIVDVADQIIFVNDGRVEGIGTYVEMTKGNSRFAELLVKQ